MKGVDVAWLLRGNLELGAVHCSEVTVFSKGPLDGRPKQHGGDVLETVRPTRRPSRDGARKA